MKKITLDMGITVRSRMSFAAFAAVILMSSVLGFTDVDGGSVSETLQKAKALFGNNYPRLQQIKSKHDPELLFSKWFPIIPAVEA